MINTQVMIENFGDKRNSNGFDKRPQDTKKGGRKRSSFKSITEELKLDGYVPVNKLDYKILLSTLINLPQKDLEKIEKLEDTPLYIKSIILTMKDKKNRFKAICQIRDWLFGKEGFDPKENHNGFRMSNEEAEARAQKFLKRAKEAKAKREMNVKK